MENYISILVATLEELSLIDKNQAEKLNKTLRESTIPSTYNEAKALIKKAFEETKN